jgi:hypothetical protein
MNDPCIDPMRTALRVLSAVLEGHPPPPSDVESLHKFAPLLKDGPVDELACDVIQQAMKRRAQLRRAGRDGA